MAAPRPGFEACTGCDVCLLGCPVWRATRDVRVTPHGRAKALQHGASVADMAVSIDACTLCGSCEPACPENIALVDLLLSLRNELAAGDKERSARIDWRRHRIGGPPVYRGTVLMPAAGTPAMNELCSVLGQGVQIADDVGSDILLALESGVAIPENRRAEFLEPLRNAGRILVGDGLLAHRLQSWLPRARIEPLGQVVSALPAVRSRLRADDLYVIESRSFHRAHARLVNYYDELRTQLGCGMNLDLQRLAIPTTRASAAEVFGINRVDPRDQARWIMEGVACERIVLEDERDRPAFEAVTEKPVLHLAQLLQAAA